MKARFAKFIGTLFAATGDFLRAHVTRRLGSISLLGDGDVRSLKAHEIHNQDALLDRFEAGTIGSISTDTGLPAQKIAGALDETLDLSGKRSESRLKRHWFDLVVVLLVGVLWLLCSPATRRWLDALTPKPAQVVAVRDIPAFSSIRSRDLKVENEPSADAQEKLVKPMVGTYALGLIAKGSTVTGARVSSKPLDLSGKTILRISYKNGPQLDGRALPQTVEVLFTPRDDPGEGAQFTAIALALDSTAAGAIATLAVDPAEGAAIAKWLGSSDVYLALQIP